MKGNDWSEAGELGRMHACYLKLSVNTDYFTLKPGVARDPCQVQHYQRQILTWQGRHSCSHLEAASRHDLIDNMAMGFLCMGIH